MNPHGIILVSDTEAAMIEAKRRQKAQQLVDKVLQYHGKQRWIATRALWFYVHPQARQDHIDAVLEARELKKSLIDPRGLSRQTLGIAHGERGNKNTYRRLMAVFPEELKTMLKRFDPLNLAGHSGEKAREMWREVYETFPEYLVTDSVKNYRKHKTEKVNLR